MSVDDELRKVLVKSMFAATPYHDVVIPLLGFQYLEQQGGYRFAEPCADAPFAADLPAGAAVNPHLRSGGIPEDDGAVAENPAGRVALALSSPPQPRYCAVLPATGICAVPSLRWSQLRTRLGTTRTATRLFIIWSTNGRMSSV